MVTSMYNNHNCRIASILKKWTKHNIHFETQKLKSAGSTALEQDQKQWLNDTVNNPEELLKDLGSDNDDNESTFERFSNSGDKARDILDNNVEIVISSDKEEKSESEEDDDFIVENSYSDEN
jgi:hypothetical protein